MFGVNEMHRFYYHHTPSENRDSIRERGLLLSMSYSAQTGGYGAIYLTDKPTYSEHIDVWRVDVSGLEVESDDTAFGIENFPGESWYEVFSDISPERLRLEKGSAGAPIDWLSSTVKTAEAN